MSRWTTRQCSTRDNTRKAEPIEAGVRARKIGRCATRAGSAQSVNTSPIVDAVIARSA